VTTIWADLYTAATLQQCNIVNCIPANKLLSRIYGRGV